MEINRCFAGVVDCIEQISVKNVAEVLKSYIFSRVWIHLQASLTSSFQFFTSVTNKVIVHIE